MTGGVSEVKNVLIRNKKVGVSCFKFNFQSFKVVDVKGRSSDKHPSAGACQLNNNSLQQLLDALSLVLLLLNIYFNRIYK